MAVDSPRRIVLAVASAALLAGPTVLAFCSGGYFAPARAGAGIGAWALVAVTALVRRPPAATGSPPRTGPSGALSVRHAAPGLVIGGLGGLAAWTMLSMLWAPVAGGAYGAAQLVVLYLGALIAATLLLGAPAVRRWVEPALGAGAVIVIGYGVSERLLPGVLHFARSVSAQGRLQQPLTYWNAMGELAALGFVLCAGVAGNPGRPAWQRIAAAAATAPLGLGLYLSFSRGALFACLAGLVTLVVAARSSEQLRSAGLAVASGVLASVAAAPFTSVTSLVGPLSRREREGAVTLALLILVMLAAAAGQKMLSGRPATRRLRLPRRAPLIATMLICAGLAGAIVIGAKETSGLPVLSGGATRLVSLESNRYDYWDVALRAFATSPLHGVGAGGWSIYWLRWRTVNEFAQTAHSLELETMAELGVVGVALLAAFAGGVAVSARRVLSADRAVAGTVAALVVYAVHSPLDWDWQMPAVTLAAIVLAGQLLARSAGAPVSAPGVRAPRRSAAPPG
jgi:hypothetical protein